MFTDKEHRGPFEFSDEIGNLSIGADTADNVVPAHMVEANDKDLLLSTSEKEESNVSANNGSAYSAPLFDSSPASVSSLSTNTELAISGPISSVSSSPSSSTIDDLLGLALGPSPTPAPAPAPLPPPLKLNSKAAMDPGTFQAKWRQLSIALSQVGTAILCLLYLLMFISSDRWKLC